MPHALTPDSLAHVAGLILWQEYARRLQAARARLAAATPAAKLPPPPIPFPCPPIESHQPSERSAP